MVRVMRNIRRWLSKFISRSKGRNKPKTNGEKELILSLKLSNGETIDIPYKDLIKEYTADDTDEVSVSPSVLPFTKDPSVEIAPIITEVKVFERDKEVVNS